MKPTMKIEMKFGQGLYDHSDVDHVTKLSIEQEGQPAEGRPVQRYMLWFDEQGTLHLEAWSPIIIEPRASNMLYLKMI